MTDAIFRNARLLLPDDVIEGSVRIVDGQIAGIDSGATERWGCPSRM